MVPDLLRSDEVMLEVVHFCTCTDPSSVPNDDLNS